MKRVILACALLTVALAPLPAQAQHGSLTRSFVSSTGVDTNPCTITQPCATFAEAYTKIGANGIIAALDPGKYGPLTGTSAITSGVTINGNGWAAITGPAGGIAITVSAGPNDAVKLSGLEIDGANTAKDGIAFESGNSLIVSNCVIRQFTVAGLVLNAVSSDTELNDSTIENNEQYGVLDAPVGAGTQFNFDHDRFLGNITAGVSLQDANVSEATIMFATGSNSVASSNGIGFDAVSQFSNSEPLLLVLDHVTAVGNTTAGLRARGGNIDLSRSFIANNAGINRVGYLIQNNGGIFSTVDNRIWDLNATGIQAGPSNLIQ
jgi:hypothetical protein